MILPSRPVHAQALLGRLPARSPHASTAPVAIVVMPLLKLAEALAVGSKKETVDVKVAVAAALGIAAAAAAAEVEVAGTVVEEAELEEVVEGRIAAGEAVGDSAVAAEALDDTSPGSVGPAVVIAGAADEVQRLVPDLARHSKSSTQDLLKVKPLVDSTSGCCGLEHTVTSWSIADLILS